MSLMVFPSADVARQVYPERRSPCGWLFSGWIGRRRHGASPGRGEGRASLDLLRPPPGMHALHMSHVLSKHERHCCVPSSLLVRNY